MGLDRVDLLDAQMEEAYGLLRDRLEGLSDEEYLWEPVPGAWTLHRRPDGSWDYDYEEPDPEPAPFTTIGWRLHHVASCKVMYHEYAFGPRRRTWWTLENPGERGPMMQWLEEGQRLLASDLRSLDDDDELDAPRLTNWGEEWPTWKIFWTMIHHDAHHGAEIACLRDLYRWTHSSSG
jgi:DinB superfamily